MSNSKLKTASELALEYWAKPPIERVNNTLQDYVYDYMMNKIIEKDAKSTHLVISLNNIFQHCRESLDDETFDLYGEGYDDACKDVLDKRNTLLDLKLSDNPILQANVYKYRNTDHGDIFNSFELFDLNINSKEENENNG